MRHRRQATRRRRGYTLIELVATIVIIGALGSVASMIMVQVVDTYSKASTSAQVHTELSVGMDRAVRELRKIVLDDGASGTAPHINQVTATSITWWDSDDDWYALTLAGSDVTLAVDAGSANTLLTDVSSFSVQAVDDGGVDMAATLSGAACDDIRRIRLTVTVTRNGVAETLRTLVYLRATMSQE